MFGSKRDLWDAVSDVGLGQQGGGQHHQSQMVPTNSPRGGLPFGGNNMQQGPNMLEKMQQGQVAHGAPLGGGGHILMFTLLNDFDSIKKAPTTLQEPFYPYRPLCSISITP